MIGNCKDCHVSGATSFSLDFECDEDTYSDLNVWRGDIDLAIGKTAYDRRSRFDRFDYAYAITCHKSQGSEFDSVVIYKEPTGSDIESRRKWIYTAISRGKNKVTLVEP